MPSDPVHVARRLSAMLLSQVPHDPRSQKPVSLTDFANFLDVAILRRTEQGLSAGALWPRVELQPSLFGDVAADVPSQSFRDRFTLAHELGHRVADIYLDRAETAGWNEHAWKSFVDSFAAKILLPDDLLRATMPISGKSLILEGLLDAGRRLQVSISCLTGRLNDLVSENKLAISGCALVVCAAVSTKKGEHYAPRILTRCVERDWYIPINIRLQTLGMDNLSNSYWRDGLYHTSMVDDTFVVWERFMRKQIRIARTFRYVIYKSTEGKRIMFATCGSEGE